MPAPSHLDGHTLHKRILHCSMKTKFFELSSPDNYLEKNLLPDPSLKFLTGMIENDEERKVHIWKKIIAVRGWFFIYIRNRLSKRSTQEKRKEKWMPNILGLGQRRTVHMSTDKGMSDDLHYEHRKMAEYRCGTKP